MQLLGSLSLNQKLRIGPRSPLFYKLAFHYPYCFYTVSAELALQTMHMLQDTAVEFPDFKLISARPTEMSDPKTKLDGYELHLTKQAWK